MANKIKKASRKNKERKEEKTINKPEEDLSRFTVSPQVIPQGEGVSEESKVVNTDEQVKKTGGNSFWSTGTGKVWTMIFILCLAAAIIVGLLIFQSINKGSEEPQAVLAPVPVSQEMPSPTPKAVDFSTYKIKVLNGSGITGEAAVVKSLLEKDNVKVESIDNATNSAFEKSIIAAKKSVEQGAAAQIKEILVGYRFENDSILDDLEESDIIITIGSSKN